MEQKYHIWPRAYDPRDWKAGSIIKCEGKDCWMCKARWEIKEFEFKEAKDA